MIKNRNISLRGLQWLNTFSFQRLKFDVPGRQKTVDDRSDQEGVQPLVLSCRGRIVRRGDIAVMTAVVFDKKVHVQRRQQQRFGHPFLEFACSMTEFVATLIPNDPHIRPIAEIRPTIVSQLISDWDIVAKNQTKKPY